MKNNHRETPIHCAAFKLKVATGRHMPKMPRDFRSEYGSEFRGLASGIVRDVRYASKARDAEKVPHLDRLLDRVEDANDLYMMARDLGHLKNSHFAEMIELTGSLGRQAGGLRKKYAPAA